MAAVSADSGVSEGVSLSMDAWPLVRIEVGLPPGREVARKIRAALRRGLERAEPHVAIVNLRVSGLPSPGLLLDQAEWFEENRRELGNYCRGLAIVTRSAAMRTS